MESNQQKKIIKVCGLREIDNVKELAKLPISWFGFIDYPNSKRSISAKDLDWISTINTQQTVGVVVNKELEDLLQFIKQGQFDFIQLHGDESPEYCAEIREQIPVLKAISVNDPVDLIQAKQYIGAVDYFLFDTKHANLRGGSGQQFDWSILEDYDQDVPFLLSGGISADDAQKLKNFVHPQFAGIDINSKFELVPGRKDVQLVQSFIQEFLS